MKKFIKSAITGAATLALGLSMVLSLGGGATAATCWQYDANGFPTSQTPVFNNICGVPGYGDESDFVRVRPSNGDPTSTSNNADYTSNLNSACADGSKFDVHTYIHNDAEPDFNDNGSGSAVAHDVKLAMSAPLGQTATKFTFTSKITASNATAVSDSATLNCNGEAVKLSLVPSTVKIYGSNAYGWTGLTDGAVNGSTKLGNPTIGSGDVYGCWHYRIAVVYQVVVHKVSKPAASTGICKVATGTVDEKDQSATVTVQGDTTNATVVGYRIDFGDGTIVNKQTATHKYQKPGKYTIKTYVKIKYANGTTSGWITSDNCQISLTIPKLPPHIPPKPPVTPPTHLVETGPGSIATLFAGTSGLSAAGHWFYRRHKYGRQ